MDAGIAVGWACSQAMMRDTQQLAFFEDFAADDHALDL